MAIDIRLAVTFWEHPKTIKLQRRLGLEAVTSLIKLWMWAAANRPEGGLEKMDDEDITIAAAWKGEASGFVGALVELNWLDGESGNYSIHDWYDHNPWVADAETRSNEARFLRLATVDKPAYERLKAEGVVSISKKEYAQIRRDADVTPTRRQRKPNAPSTQAQRAVGVSPTRRLTPDPDPDPDPNPDPDPDLKTKKDPPLVPPVGFGEKADSPAEPADLPEPPKSGGTPPPPTFFEQVEAEYHRLLPELPKIAVRSSKMVWVFKQSLEAFPERRALDFWQDFFNRVRGAPFLMGQLPNKPGKKKDHWLATLGWLLEPENTARVLNGEFSQDQPKGETNGNSLTGAAEFLKSLRKGSPP